MVVITGGSEGIGYALARRFAAAGNPVMLVARRAGPLEEAAAAIRADYKVEAVAVPVDVTEPDAISSIDRALAAHRAYADVVVNSAGIGLAGPFHVHCQDLVQRCPKSNMPSGATRSKVRVTSSRSMRGHRQALPVTISRRSRNLSKPVGRCCSSSSFRETWRARPLPSFRRRF